MKQIVIFLLFFLVIQFGLLQIVFSQQADTAKNFQYPNIKKYGKTLDDFSPQNWEITDTISGDLNKDGVDDFALVLGYKDSIKITDGYRYPRLLLLVFKVGNQYQLKLQHNTLIEREVTDESGHTGSWNGDIFQNIEIINGVIKLQFEWDILGAGTIIQYAVRYQSNDFYLIGATHESGHRADVKNASFNFSTKRYIYDEVDDESGFGGEYHEYHKKGKLPANSLKKLIDIKGVGTWDILQGVII